MGGLSRDVAGQGGQTQTEANVNQFCIDDGKNASAAARRGLVGGLERVLAGRTVETLPELIVELARSLGVEAAVSNLGLFWISGNVSVCHRDIWSGGKIETGWSRVKFPSIDGKLRHSDEEAPQVLVSPDGKCLLWQPHGGLRKQRRVTLSELSEFLAELGDRLARLEVAA